VLFRSDLLLEKGIPHRVYTYHQWSDEEILGRALRDVEESDARFFFVYLCEMDLLLHNQWTNPAPLEQKLNWYAGRLRQLFQAARRIDPGATFAVTSDHGMTPVRGQYDLVRDVAALGLKLPEDYLAVYDSTMARFWFFSDRARTQLVRTLDSLFFADRRYGGTIFLLHPGWLIARSDFNGPGWVPAGMHGYHPDDPYSDAIFLSNRRPSSAVRGIADVYGVMREAVDSTEL